MRFSGQALRQAREDAGLRPEGLAVAAGISASAITMIELNYRFPSVPVLARLADALDINTDDLFEREPIPA